MVDLLGPEWLLQPHAPQDVPLLPVLTEILHVSALPRLQCNCAPWLRPAPCAMCSVACAALAASPLLHTRMPSGGQADVC